MRIGSKMEATSVMKTLNTILHFQTIALEILVTIQKALDSLARTTPALPLEADTILTRLRV
jgi:hypothetical protein